jgi:hypothetical protein
MNDNGFGFSKIKAEGTSIHYDTESPSKKKGVDFTWVERRVPESLEEEVHTMIDKFLRDKGFK